MNLQKSVFKRFTLSLVTAALSITHLPVRALEPELHEQLREVDFSRPLPIVDMETVTYKKDPTLRNPYNYYEEEEPEGELIAIDKYSKTYQISDNDFITVIGGDTNVYQSENGSYELIDNNLVLEGTSEYFANAANSYSVKLPAGVTEDNEIYLFADGYRVGMKSVEGDFSRPVTAGNAVLYNDVYDGIDYQYTVMGELIKEDIILNHAVEKNTFSFELDTDGLKPRLEGNVLGLYADNQEEPVCVITAPEMIDASGEMSIGMALTLEGDILTLTADKEWLTSVERAYPVRIDPTISITDSSITMIGVEQGSPNMFIGDNQFPYVGYDDGIVSGNLNQFGTAHLMCRTYVGVNYDFSQIPVGSKIKNSTFKVYHYTNWSKGKTNFGLYSVDQEWINSRITWNKQKDFSHTFIEFQQANTRAGWLEYNVTDVVNSWVQGLAPNYGFVLKAEDERNMQCEVFRNNTHANKPVLTIEWSNIPDPVDPDYGIDSTTITLRPMTEKNVAGKLRFDGVFADGTATPESLVHYWLTPGNISGDFLADVSYKYPDSSFFEEKYPEATKYKDKLGNWQTGLYEGLEFDKAYIISATASKDGVTGKQADSDKFLIYKVKQMDTFPYIARYYGVPLNTIMRDNRVQDTLVVENNTIFIRNPNTEVAYSPEDLTDDAKKAIDSSLMGRGLHCEYGFEPINLNTGNFYYETVDASIDDLGGSFAIERTYNSKLNGTNSSFGKNWRFAYDEILSFLEDGRIAYSVGDGKTLYYTPVGNGEYSSPAGYHNTLKAIEYVVDDVTYTRYELHEKDGSYRKFNAWGLLTDVVDEYGFTTSISYDENYRMNAIVSPSGKRYDITMDDRGRITSVGIPNGAVLRYGYDEAGNLIAYTDANGNTVRYVYDANHRMTEWYDQENNRIVLNEYDDEGRVVRQTNANGAVSTLQYTDHQTITTDANGNVTTYTYDDLMRTTRIESPNGKVEERSYDEANNLVSDYNFTYTYDELGNKLSETRKDGLTRYYTYNQRGDVTSITDFTGYTTYLEYTDNGDLTKITYADGATDNYAYDDLHRLASHTNGRGNNEYFSYTDAVLTGYTDFNGNNYQYSYNAMNQLISTVAPDGSVTRKMYDAAGTLIGEQSADEGYTQYSLNRIGNVVRVTDPLGYATDFEYDGMYNITKAIDPMGNTLSYTFDGNDNTLTQTDALGYVTAYQYGSMDQVVQKTDADGSITVYSYDVDGNLTSAVYPDGSEERIEYNPVIFVPVKTYDAEGNATEYQYDQAGTLTGIVYPDGTSLKYGYDSMLRVTEITDATGYVTHMSYDAAGNTISVTDDYGRNFTYEYDANNNLVRSTNPLGNSARYEYDALNRVVRSFDENGAQTSYEYDAVGNLSRMTDALGNAISLSYDKNGNLLESVKPNGAVTAYNYNAIGNLISVKDPLGNITNYTYDGIERLTSVTDALNGLTSYAYDAMSNVVKVTDPNNETADMAYDAMGNLKSIRLSNGDTTSFEYDRLGRVVKSTDAAGLITSFAYNNMGYPTAVSDNTGSSIAYAYDEFGRLVSQTDQIGRTGTYEYDSSSQIIAATEIDHNRSSFEYDLLGNLVAYTDPQGIVTRYSYDNVGNQISSSRDDGRNYQYSYDAVGQIIESVNPLGARTGYSYDADGNLVSVKDANGVETRYIYDILDRMTGYINGNGNQTTISYDELSRPIQVVEPEGGITEYRYDAIGQLIKAKDANGYITEYQYDILGNIIKEISPLGAVYSYTYDKHNNRTSITDPLGNVTSYDVDLNGLVRKMTQPNGGEYTYTYDAVNRVTGIKTPLGYETTAAYDDLGNLVSLNDNMDRATTYEYDVMHRMTKVVDAMGNEYQYEYDPNGNLLKEIRANGASYTYTYNLVDQVLSATDPEGKITALSYDLVGNVLSVTEPGNRTTALSYDNNYNLTAVKDPLGNVTKRIYDRNDRLTSVVNALGDAISYEYDPLGQVTKITSPSGNTEKYGYDAHGNLTNVIDLAGNETIYSYDLADHLVSVTDPQSRVTHYTYDTMGNIISSTDADNKTVTYGYDLEGNLTELKDAKGTTKQTYDLLGNLKSVVSPDSTVVSYDYDKLNNLVSKNYTQDEDCNVIYLYDTEGNRISMKDQTGENTYTYDTLDRITSVTYPNGKSVKYAYDDANNLASVTYPDGKVVSYTYDLNDQLISVNDNGKETTYKYDELGRVYETLRPDGSKTSYIYDKDGKIVDLVNNDAKGKVVSSFAYTYNEQGYIGQETAVNGKEKATRTYEYNPSGELVKFIEKNSKQTLTYSYSYDNTGNRTKLVKTGGEKPETITYTYNEVGQLTGSNSTITGKTAYTYNANGSLISEKSKDSEITYEYSVEQRLTAVREGGELLMAASYDGDGNRLFQISKSQSEEYVEKSELSAPSALPYGTAVPAKDAAKDEPLVNSIHKGYHEEEVLLAPVNDVTGFDSTPVSNTDITNTYYERIYVDPADDIFWYGFGQGIANFIGTINPALAALLSEMWDKAWQFVTGQYTLLLHSEAVEAAGYSEEDVLAMRNAGLKDQEIVEIIAAAIDNSTYPADHTGSQKSAVKPNGVAKPDGKEKPHSEEKPFIPSKSETDKNRVDYELTHYINDINTENTEVLMEYGKRNEVKNSYTYGIERISDDVIAKVNKSGKATYQTKYYLYDGRGSVSDVINSSSSVAATYTYDPFGNVTSGAPDFESFYGYNAEETNPATGLQYLRARYYDTEKGRFGVLDTYIGRIKSPLTLNRYSYTVNNPVMYEDPSGQFLLTALVIGAVAGAVIGGAVGGVTSYREQAATGNVNGWEVAKRAVIGAGLGALGGAAGGAAVTVAMGVGVGFAVTAGVGAVATAAGASTVYTGISNARIAEIEANALSEEYKAAEKELEVYLREKGTYSDSHASAERTRLIRLYAELEKRRQKLCADSEKIKKQIGIGSALISGGVGLMAIGVGPAVAPKALATMAGSNVLPSLPVLGSLTYGGAATIGVETVATLGTTMAASEMVEAVTGANPIKDNLPDFLSAGYDEAQKTIDSINTVVAAGSVLMTIADPSSVDQAANATVSQLRNNNSYSEGFLKWLNKGEANTKVYAAIDPNGDEVYSGITKQSREARLGQHQRNEKPFVDLNFRFEGQTFTRNQARALEQYYIENGPNKFNQIMSISQSAPYYEEAMRWATEFIMNH